MTIHGHIMNSRLKASFFLCKYNQICIFKSSVFLTIQIPRRFNDAPQVFFFLQKNPI